MNRIGPGTVRWESPRGGSIELADGRMAPFLALASGGAVWIWLDGRTYRWGEESPAAGRPAEDRGPAGAPASPTAPVPGRVERVVVKAGDTVEAGSLLVTISAMKMEHEIRASRPGQVQEVRVKEGDRVEAGDLLVRIDPAR